VGFFRQHFPRIIVVQSRNLAHCDKTLGTGDDLGEICLRDDVVDIGISRLTQAQSGIDVEFPGCI